MRKQGIQDSEEYSMHIAQVEYMENTKHLKRN
jgi:hypothetical protein